MSHFLIVYDRPRGRLLSMREYADSEQEAALSDRLAYDAALKYPSDLEVVVLSSPSEAALRRTHASYFAKSPAELEEQLGQG